MPYLHTESEPEPLCEQCDRPEDDCVCVHCDHCGDYVGTLRSGTDTCGDCRLCYECCNCAEEDYEEDDEDEESSVPMSRRPLLFHQAVGEPFRLAPDKNYLFRKPAQGFARNPSRRFIACELEVHSLEVPRARLTDEVCRKWSHSVVGDGSIESSRGFEINTAPAQGDRFIEMIEELCGALNKEKARVTQRCGYHVHVDARDFNFWDVRRLCLLYKKIEGALFECVSHSRRTNNFCVACSDSLGPIANDSRAPKRGYVASLYNTTNMRQLQEMKSDKYAQCRYWALNLHSWNYRGTIESRLHQGTTNARKVWAWGVLWAGILDFVVRTPESAIKRLGDGFDTLLLVAPTDQVREYLVERRATFNRVTEEVG